MRFDDHTHLPQLSQILVELQWSRGKFQYIRDHQEVSKCQHFTINLFFMHCFVFLLFQNGLSILKQSFYLKEIINLILYLLFPYFSHIRDASTFYCRKVQPWAFIDITIFVRVSAEYKSPIGVPILFFFLLFIFLNR